MNYLAHFYLTHGLEEITAGNFIADFVRSSQQHLFTSGVLKGIEIHRSIDSFTDEHDVVKQSKQRLYEKYHKYSTVIVDLFYDHFLAVNWTMFSNIPLAQFCHETYSLLRRQQHVFPAEAQRMFHFMSAYDWLYSYHHIDGIRRALRGLSYRARFKSGMENADEDLRQHYPEFEKEFLGYFPELSDRIKGMLG